MIHPQAVVAQDVTLGNGTVVMVGAVVVKNIDEPGIYVGVPAKRIDRKE